MATMSVRRRTIVLCGVACLGVIVYVGYTAATGGTGFPLDDSWIHQVFARNLAQTGQWAFVPGMPSAASTSPLYTVVLALGYLFHLPYALWTYTLGAAALASAGLIGARLAEQLFPDIPRTGLTIGLMIVTTWHIVWAAAAGMETALFSALCLALIALTWREMLPSVLGGIGPAFGRGLVTGAIGALVTLTRPEGVVLVGLCGLVMLLAHPHRGWSETVVWVAGLAIACGIGISPDLLLNYSLNGTLLPNTSTAKQAEFAPLLVLPLWQRILNMLGPLAAGAQLTLVPGAIYVAAEIAKRARVERRTLLFWVAPLWIGGLVLVYALKLPAPYQHGRYVLPALPVLVVFGGTGTLALALRYRRRRVPRILTQTLLITAILVFGFYWLIGATVYRQDVQEINGEMVTASHWIAANIPTDTPFATHDIGAIGYFAPRQLVDLAGLVSPDIVPIINDGEAKMKYMQAHGVQYMMVSIAQMPVPTTDPRLCPLYTTPANSPPEIHMTVYRLAWDGHCPAMPPAASNAAGNGSP